MNRKGVGKMELIDAIKQRKSIRAFTEKQVPKNVIMEILNIACRAPSAMNTQPWEFVVVSGRKLDKLRAAIVEKLKRGAPIVPVHLVVSWPKVLGEAGPLLDLGAVMQNICLAAMQFGLGTCIEDQGVLYPEVFREHTGIPQTKRLMIAIAIGYPDEDFPANKIRSERESAENLTTWVE